MTARGLTHGVVVTLRLSTEEVARLDVWIADQKEKSGVEVSRPAAVRAVLEKHLPKRKKPPGSE